jgi:hypothetical protein
MYLEFLARYCLIVRPGLSFSLGDSTRVASELPWKERNNLMVFLFRKILLIYFTTRYPRRVKRSEKRAVTDVRS